MMNQESEEEIEMIRHPRKRQALALFLTILGGVAFFLAPEGIWVGALLLGLGLALEVAGRMMQRDRQS